MYCYLNHAYAIKRCSLTIRMALAFVQARPIVGYSFGNGCKDDESLRVIEKRREEPQLKSKRNVTEQQEACINSQIEANNWL